MKRLTQVSVVLATSVLANGVLHGQNTPRPGFPQSHFVALVDIARVFEEHKRFNAAMDQMKNEAKSFEGEMTRERDAILKKRQQLANFKPGSNEYKRMEQEIAQRLAGLKVKVELKRKDFLEREARLYHDTYKLIVRAVGDTAARNNISLVLRFDSEQIEADNRAAIMKAVNRPVIFQRQLDITNNVLQRLNGPSVSQKTPRPTTNGNRLR